MVNEDERIDDLQLEGLKLVQNKKQFCFGTDAVLISYFAQVKHNASVIDLGTGNGVIPLLLYGRYKPRKIVGLEIQKDIYDLAVRNAQYNGLEDKISFVHGDIRNVKEYFIGGLFDHVVTNPPYLKSGTGIVNSNDVVSNARHEILCTLEDILKASRYLLKSKGIFTMVHRPERLTDILSVMRLYSIEPKTIRFIHSSANNPAILVLVQGLKDMNPALSVKAPLIMCNADGSYTDELNMIYGRNR
ncbi:MAG: tRNA1(Val) (adenine(37)-N6)-methyltransferase [Clostridia bacterium]|jgi:tRNA1(Val) A37 N6-methylase TrmN6